MERARAKFPGKTNASRTLIGTPAITEPECPAMAVSFP
jgi:hypothetical protein